LLKFRPMEKTIDLTQIIITLYYCKLHELVSSTPCYLQARIKLTTLPMMSIITCLVIVSEGILVSAMLKVASKSNNPYNYLFCTLE
jgi:hypothetical protein